MSITLFHTLRDVPTMRKSRACPLSLDFFLKCVRISIVLELLGVQMGINLSYLYARPAYFALVHFVPSCSTPLDEGRCFKSLETENAIAQRLVLNALRMSKSSGLQPHGLLYGSCHNPGSDSCCKVNIVLSRRS